MRSVQSPLRAGLRAPARAGSSFSPGALAAVLASTPGPSHRTPASCALCRSAACRPEGPQAGEELIQPRFLDGGGVLHPAGLLDCSIAGSLLIRRAPG